MANNTLEIILQAKDEATGTINNVKTSLDGVSKTTADVTKKSEEAGKSIKQQFKEASSQVRDFRKTMLLASLALAAVIATTKEAAQYSTEAKKSYDQFDISIKTLAVTIGQLLSPALEGVRWIVSLLTDTIESAVAGFIKLSTFIVALFANLKEGPVEAYKQAMAEANAATDVFLGKIEVTRARVASGLTFEKEKKNINDLKNSQEAAAQASAKRWEFAKQTLSDFGTALAEAAVLSKGFAKASAAISIGMAIVNTAEGITRAYKEFPFPLASVFAGIIAATGAMQIATIAATKFATGGIVTGPTLGLVGEAGPEAIIPLSKMGSMGLGGGHNIHIEINYPTIRSTEDIDALTEEISTRLAREADRL